MDKMLGNLVPRDPDFPRLQDDLERIAQVAGWPRASLRVVAAAGPGNRAKIRFTDNRLEISVQAEPGERASTLYHALHTLGFLFPHPRWQVSPSFAEAVAKAGAEIEWQPTVQWRGFHFHTQHPNEWVHGFFMGQDQIAEESIRWLVRNRQNVLQLALIRLEEETWPNLYRLFQEAKTWGLQVGVSLSFSMIQQRSFHLVPLWRALSGVGADEYLKAALDLLYVRLPLDMLTVELGTSEFTPLSYTKTLRWLEETGAWHEEKQKAFFVKVHVSSNQVDAKLGNYNFLPEHCGPAVGAHVHTVYAYALEDEAAPMYGRKNFLDLRDFLLRQKNADNTWRRPTWYYPETSYFVGLDLDVPLLLTYYLETRQRDWEFLRQHQVQGNINFTTGHEVGYWLMDWCAALGADRNFAGPLSALEMLGESREVWQKILDFQREYFFERQGIACLVGSNLMDELPMATPIHGRHLLRHLRKDEAALSGELALLQEMRQKLPALDGVKNQELCELLEITWLRVEHAYWIRRALSDKNCLSQAQDARERALEFVESYRAEFERYPEAALFARQKNPTSYQYGYAWTAGNLHFWLREEEMIRRNRFHPFFLNIYNVWKLLF